MPFVSTAAARVVLRPRKIAYLVQRGHIDRLEEVIEYASTEWGGQGQLIVPVHEGGVLPELYWETLLAVRPEVFIDFAESTGLPDDLRNRLGADVVRIAHLRQGMTEPGANLLCAVQPPVIYPGSATYGPEPVWHSPKGTSLIDLISLGRVSDDHVTLWRQRGYGPAGPPSAADVLLAQANGTSLIARSFDGCGYQRIEGWIGGLYLFIYSDLDFDDATNFWNLRAAAPPKGGIYVYFCSPDALSDQRVRQAIEHSVVMKEPSKPDLFVSTDQPAQVEKTFREWGWKKSGGKRYTVSHRRREGRDLSSEPIRYALNELVDLHMRNPREEGVHTVVSLTLESPKTIVRSTSPINFAEQWGGFLSFEIHDVPRWSWPDGGAAAQLVHPDAKFRNGGLALVTVPSDHYQFEFSIPDPQQMLFAHLRELGYEAAVSDKGRYAGAVKQFIGGLEYCNIFRDPTVQTILGALCSPNRKRFAQHVVRDLGGSLSVEDIAARLADVPFEEERWRSLGEVASELKVQERKLEPAFRALVDRRLARRAIRHQCQVCGLRQQILLERATDHFACAGCGHVSLVGGRIGIDIVCALNPLVDRAWDQGALQHLITLSSIHEKLPLLIGHPGLVLKNQDETVEVDCVGVSGRWLIAGEVKATCQAFDDDEVERMIRIADGLRADWIVLSAFDDWPRPRRTQIEKTLGDRRCLILGATDLKQPVY